MIECNSMLLYGCSNNRRYIKIYNKFILVVCINLQKIAITIYEIIAPLTNIIDFRMKYLLKEGLR